MKAIEKLEKIKNCLIPTKATLDFMIDEVILELEALNNRSCESCSNFNPNIKNLKYAVCAKNGNMTVPHNFCCNRWESR